MNFEVSSRSDVGSAPDTAARPGSQPDESPSLPGLPTWRRVYLFILAAFVLYVALMRVFQGFFS